MQIKLAKAPGQQKKQRQVAVVVGMQRISCFNICAAAPRAMLLTCTTEWGEWELRPVPSRDLLINSSSSLSRNIDIMCTCKHNLFDGIHAYIYWSMVIGQLGEFYATRAGWMGGICWAIPLTVTITRVPAVLISPDFGTSVFRNNYVQKRCDEKEALYLHDRYH